ncbi:MAG: hypothetical protein KGR69_10105 [Verrucomicrobia bacterium]|nr:hypothetical protein [Verrucomicrobiota bacterium]
MEGEGSPALSGGLKKRYLMPPFVAPPVVWNSDIMLAKRETINWGIRGSGSPARSRLRCGHLLVEVSRGENEVSLASKRLTEEEAGLGPDEPVAWTSWAVCTGARGVKVLPGLPDLAVLAQTDEAFEVAPGGEARVFLRIPVSVQVRLSDRDDELLAEFPSESMPRVHFGEGPGTLLCYRLSEPALRFALADLESSVAQAPVLIRNESRETLTVTQLCLRVARLSVYRAGTELWTSETIARYQGGLEASRLHVKSGPPAEVPRAKVLAVPRESGPGTFVARTFRSFRRWAGDWR